MTWRETPWGSETSLMRCRGIEKCQISGKVETSGRKGPFSSGVLRLSRPRRVAPEPTPKAEATGLAPA